MFDAKYIELTCIIKFIDKQCQKSCVCYMYHVFYWSPSICPSLIILDNTFICHLSDFFQTMHHYLVGRTLGWIYLWYYSFVETGGVDFVELIRRDLF